MKSVFFWMCVACAAGFGLAACGDDDGGEADGGDGDTDTDTDTDTDSDTDTDTDTDTDGDVACGETTEIVLDPTTAVVTYASGTATVWSISFTPDVASGEVADRGQLEFYEDATGTFDLASAGVNDNYATCMQCARAFADYEDTDSTVVFYQMGGSMTVDLAPLTEYLMLDVSLSDVTLIESTIDASYNSTPVNGGMCLHIAAYDAAIGCGDGVITGAEECDGDNLADAGCPDENYESGTLSCGDTCTFDTAECTGWICGADDLGTFSGADITRTAVDGCASGSSAYSPVDTDCTGYGSFGMEMVYSLTLPAAADVTVTMTPADTDIDPSLWATTACDDLTAASCVAGADENIDGEAETINLSNSGDANATYYIVADSYYTDACGTFDLSVTDAAK